MNAPAWPPGLVKDLGWQGEAAPGVHWLRLPLPFKPEDHINVWLIEDGEALAIVDTGLADEESLALWQSALAENEASRRAPTRFEKSALAGRPLSRPISRVFVTHHHPDHIGLAAWFAETFAAKVFMPEQEARLAARLLATEEDAALAATYAAHGMPAELGFVELRRRFYREHVKALPAESVAVKDGERFRMGGAEWVARLAGGHTPAHMLLHCPEKKLLIAGDHILPDIVTNIGALSFDPHATPVADYLASLERLARLPADTLVLPAHGLPFVGLAARCERLAAIHRERLMGVLRAVAAADTIWQMLPHLYGREMTGLAALLAFNQTKAYLDHLAVEGRVVGAPDAAGRIRYHCAKADA